MNLKTISFRWACFAGFLALTYMACNEFDSFGSDLLDSDWLQAKGDAIYDFTAGPAAEDSILTFNNFSTLGASGFVNRAFPIGKMDDPLFGQSSAGFGTQLRFIPTKVLDFLKYPVDSVVISMRYDTGLFYGKYAEPMSIGVYGLKAAYNSTASYYSNFALPVDYSQKFGALTEFIPNRKDSLTILQDTTTLKVFPQLRISLDTGKFMSVLRSFADTVYFTSDSFTRSFNGLAFICEKGNGYISVMPEHGDSKISIYYKDSSNTKLRTEFYMSSLAVKTPYYQRDPGTSTAAGCYNGSISGDSLLCLQGTAGRDFQLKLPYQPQWSGKLINYAVLQFYVADLPGLEVQNYPLPSLLEVFDQSSGSRVAIEDVALAIGSQSQYKRAFGGYPISEVENGKTNYLYKMNITRHFQKALKSKSDINLVLAPFAKLESPARLFLNGRNGDKYRAKLILTYSE